MKKVIILGGGLSAISLACFLQDDEQIENITILEKDDDIGGLCRSIHKDGYTYDIGPHIIFSKDKEMLQLLIDVLPETNKLRRSNQIIHKGTYVQYPFENDLSKLSEEDLKYALSAFQNNPYEDYEVNNMLQFFLKTFGEGITNLYLRPYNEKIWKHDPAFMDTQMVERIPKPTNEEILRSASGETVDGYVHQLYFDYPKNDGIEAVVKGFAKRLTNKCTVLVNQTIEKICKAEDGTYITQCHNSKMESDLVISTIPVQELTRIYDGAEKEIGCFVENLKYNSIIIAFVTVKEDLCGENFAFMIADKDILFHRISKMDFLGESYHHGGASYMIEITYRQNDWIDQMPKERLKERIFFDMQKIGFIKTPEDVKYTNITKHQYAYVIYDLNHSQNMKKIREYYKKERIYLNGRFGNFEYWNMDKVLRESKNVADKIKEAIY